MIHKVGRTFLLIENIKSLQSLSVLANLNKKHLDIDQALHTHAIETEVTETHLIKIAKSIGLKVKTHKYQSNNYENIPLPAMAETKEGAYLVVAQNRGDGFLIF